MRRLGAGIEPVGYALLCVAMWPVPLLNRLHVESAAVLAAAAFFLAGLAALRRLGRLSTIRVLVTRVAWLLLPLVLMLVPMLWAPNCGWMQGIGFFFLFPVVTTVFAVGVAAAARRLAPNRPGVLLVTLGLLTMGLGPLWDIGLHPQFYSYNHVFGGVLGPIYDEVLEVRPGLFAFRAMTLCWALMGFAVAARHNRLVVLAAGVLTLGYLVGGRLGINTGYDDLRRALPGVVETPHFEIRFDPARLDSTEAAAVASFHEFEYERIRDLLGVEPDEPVLSFVYPDAFVRARLTGARNTSVAPVWLGRPQIHVEAASLERVMPHELAHAFSREFGLPALNASLSVGLVEGLAVALEPPGDTPPVDDLVSVSLATTGQDPRQTLPSVLSPWGFWTGRGGVSYSMTGSFVSHLLRSRGAAPVRKAYATADLEAHFGAPVGELVGAWLDELEGRPILDAGAALRATARLGASSLFERDCPHWLPRGERLLEEAERALARGDSLRALDRASEALRETPSALPLWISLSVAAGRGDAVIDTLRARGRPPFGLTGAKRWADVRALGGEVDPAREVYDSLFAALPVYARDARMWLALSAAAAGDPVAIRADLGLETADEIVSPAGVALMAFRFNADLWPSEAPDGLNAWSRAAWVAHGAWAMARKEGREGDAVQAAVWADSAAAAFGRIGDLTMEAYVGYRASRFRFSYE